MDGKGERLKGSLAAEKDSGEERRRRAAERNGEEERRREARPVSAFCVLT